MRTETNQKHQEETRLLRRAVDGRILGGVAAGLAKYFGVEVSHVRIVLVALSLFGGAGVPLYLAAWVLIPVEGSDVAIADGLVHHAGAGLS
jgi:phage shock protein PspC (stress-responsive transcriptional regulator)